MKSEFALALSKRVFEVKKKAESDIEFMNLLQALMNSDSTQKLEDYRLFLRDVISKHDNIQFIWYSSVIKSYDLNYPKTTYPLNVIEPISGFSSANGFNLWESEAYWKTIASVISSKETLLSSAIMWPETSFKLQTALVSPVFDWDIDKKNIKWFVIVTYNINMLIRTALKNVKDDVWIAFYVKDISDKSSENTILDAYWNWTVVKEMIIKQKLEIAWKTWEFTAYPKEEWVESKSTKMSTLILMMGFFISLILWSHIRSSIREGKESEERENKIRLFSFFPFFNPQWVLRLSSWDLQIISDNPAAKAQIIERLQWKPVSSLIPEHIDTDLLIQNNEVCDFRFELMEKWFKCIAIWIPEELAWIKWLEFIQLYFDDITQLVNNEKNLERLSNSQIMINSELQTAREKAETANKAKWNFLSLISHEVRTPFNHILWNLDLAIKNETDPEKIERLKKVRGAADKLLRMFNDILDQAKVESGKLVLEKAGFNLKNNILEISDMLNDSATSKWLSIILDIDQSLDAVLIWDVISLQRVILNLAWNAIKFTDHWHIKISAKLESETEDHAKFHFVISDTWIWIEKDKIDRIFDMFTQADESTTRKYWWSWIWTTIAKGIIELMGWEIWIESEIWKGSDFNFTILLQKKDSTSLQYSTGWEVEVLDEKHHVDALPDIDLKEEDVLDLSDKWDYFNEFLTMIDEQDAWCDDKLALLQEMLWWSLMSEFNQLKSNLDNFDFEEANESLRSIAKKCNLNLNT